MNQTETQKFVTSLDIPVTYQRFNQSNNKPLIIFFHGFADSAPSFLRRAYPVVEDKYEVLAINAPFPVPQKKDGEWKHAFAWYFADFAKGTVYIPPKVSVKAVNDLLIHLQLQDRLKMLIAFSQGGFFVPHLLPQLKNVKHIVCIGSAYRAEDYPEQIEVTVDAIHGTADEVIDIQMAQKSFSFFKAKNPNGEFVKFENMKHTMNDQARLWLKQKIESVF